MGTYRLTDATVRDAANASDDNERLLQLIEANTAAAGGAGGIGTYADPAVTDSSLNTSGSTLVALTKGILSTLRSAFDSTLNAFIVRLKADSNTGNIFCIDITLSATAGIMTRVAIPTAARGFKIYSASAINFAVSEDPAYPRATDTNATGATKDVATGSLGIGGFVVPSQVESRLITPAAGQKLHLRSAVVSAVVSVEFFA